ncbi:MAG: hypothetical protein O6939_11900 [Bacteroidetes bacterium]|nr:hypothetical protein [Bacteroidota bacterium]
MDSKINLWSVLNGSEIFDSISSWMQARARPFYLTQQLTVNCNRYGDGDILDNRHQTNIDEFS